MWCREQKIPFETAGNNKNVNAVIRNKAAIEATKMTVSFLVNKLSLSQSFETANGVVYELRALAKTNSDSRTCMAEAGAIPLLLRYLGSDVGSEFPNLQVNAITTILNLSILEANKTKIMETDGALNGVIEVLWSGATWEAKANAAATIFSLSDRETVGRLVEAGVVEMVKEAVNVLPEEAITILEVVVKKGGIVAIAAAYNVVRKLGTLLRQGSEATRESAAASLVTICRTGGSEMVAELASISGIERIIWELMGSGTMRSRRKAATLLRILRRWAAGLDVEFVDLHTTTL
ncbi:hypothetical protein GH714_019220 [Hevea brasiliensis]|uniref:U-box domain-containing protein n=1 Tax=Hevea brasiliensis TaxID=3981 RepID=A0A6A6M160_HEVBR|nr:hypothetical protein GH714_019220 [Hevea brasiliensis]